MCHCNTYRFADHMRFDSMLLPFILSDQVIKKIKSKLILKRGKTTKESRKKLKYLADDLKQTVNWCRSDPPLFDPTYQLKDQQIEDIKKKWGVHILEQ